jgi:hypothetical protein
MADRSEGPATPTEPIVREPGLSFNHATSSFKSLAGSEARPAMPCGVSAISAIGSKSFTTS